MKGWLQSLKIMSVIVLTLALSGCGETIKGMAKDASRVGKGVKTIFTSK